MIVLRNFIGIFLLGFFTIIIHLNIVVSATSDVTEIPPVASSPRKSCSLGFSCQASSCRGGSIIGLCSKNLSNGYTLRIRGKVPSSLNLFSARYLGIPIEATKMVLRIYDGDKKPFIDLFLGAESVGISKIGAIDSLSLWDPDRISKGILLNSKISNYNFNFGDAFDIYLFYNNQYLTFLFKQKDGNYYEVGSIKVQNKVISSIDSVVGVMDYDVLFDQSMNLSIPSSYVKFYFPSNPSPKEYAGPFGLVIGSDFVLPTTPYFGDGMKLVLDQGGLLYNNGGVTYSFSDQQGSIKVKINLIYKNNRKLQISIENYSGKNVTKETSTVNIEYGNMEVGDRVSHLGFLFTEGNLLVCIRESCYAGTPIYGSQVLRMKSNVWFHLTQFYGILPEHRFLGSAIGKYKCKIGETNCEGSEMRLSNPLSPGQQVDIASSYDESGVFLQKFVPQQQKNLFGAILMGDNRKMRAAAFLSKNSVSMAVFNDNDILVDSCSIYIPSSKIFSFNEDIHIIVGLSSKNKLGVSGIVNGKKTLFCEVDASSIIITNFRSIRSTYYNKPSKFLLSNDYPAEGYLSISGGNAQSRSNQQTMNCYLTNNGNCNSMKAVHMDGIGFVQSTYLLVSSSSVTFPFVFEVISATDNSLQLVVSISSNKFSMRNVNTQDVSYAKLSPVCLEKILFEGLSLLLSSDSNNVYATMCGYLIAKVNSTSLNKKFIYNFKSGGNKNNVKVTNFQVYGGGDEALEFINEKYSANSEDTVKDTGLSFYSPCDAKKMQVTSCTGSSIENLYSQRFFSDGYSVVITGTVEKPMGSLEHVLNQGIPVDSIIQIFSFRTANDRDMYQLIITKDQMSLSIHNTNGITYYGHMGAGIPPNVNLEEGAQYRIGIGLKENLLHLFIEAPFGSNNYVMLRRRLSKVFSDWKVTANVLNLNDKTPVTSIVPLLLVRSSYTYSLSNSSSFWYEKGAVYVADKEGDISCTLPVYGTCTSTKVYMPGNKPVYNAAVFIIKFSSFKKNSLTFYFKKEDGSIVAQFEISRGSTMWNNNIKFKFKTNLEESTISFNVSLNSLEIRVSYYGRGLGYQLDGYWRVLLALGENDHFNQITCSELDEFGIEYLRSSSTDPSPWQYFNYGNKLGKSSMVLGYDQCNRGKPQAAHFASYNVYYQGSAIENMCSTSFHPDLFAVVIKSTYPNFAVEEVAKTFPNFPGFLQAIVLMYNGGVVYTLVIARKYIVLFNSVNDGNAGSFSSCASQTPNETEFKQGNNYYVTFYIEKGSLQVYFHSYIENRSALLCQIPYTKHFNSYKMLGQVNPSTAQSSTGLFYNFKRTLYSPTLSPNNLYPMGTVNTKNAVLSSGMPFSPGESLSVSMNCSYDLIFGGQTGKPQLQLSISGSQISLKNIPGKLVATGELKGDCICKANKKIVVNFAYVDNQFNVIACNTVVASILTAGASIYQISSEDSLKVIYRTDLRLAVATSATLSQISKVEEQPDTSKDEEIDQDYFVPESFEIQPILHVQPAYSS